MGAVLFYIGGALLVFAAGAALSDFVTLYFWR